MADNENDTINDSFPDDHDSTADADYMQPVDDPYYGKDVTADEVIDDKDGGWVLASFFFFPVGIYLFFKFKDASLKTAFKYLMVSVFGIIMFFVVRFLLKIFYSF